MDEKEKHDIILNNQNTPERKKKKLIKKYIKAIPNHQTPDGPLINDKLYDFIKNFENEKFALNDGMCFGEWGLIYDIKRTTSIYALEDTDLFYLEKEPFNKFLMQKFLKSDSDKVNFIMNRITLFKKEIKMRNILTKIIPVFYDKNSIVYTPYDKPEDLYLLSLISFFINVKCFFILPFNIPSIVISFWLLLIFFLLFPSLLILSLELL